MKMGLYVVNRKKRNVERLGEPLCRIESHDQGRRESRPVGYGDGYLRSLTGKAEVLIKGVRCPVIGNITMDMMMADISAVPDSTVGEEAVLVGRQGNEEITLAELAQKAGTIDYELCTLLTPRVPRIYKE